MDLTAFDLTASKSLTSANQEKTTKLQLFFPRKIKGFSSYACRSHFAGVY